VPIAFRVSIGRFEMSGTRIFVKEVVTTSAWGTTVNGNLSGGSSVSVGQYLDLFDTRGELVLSTRVIGLRVDVGAVETATDTKISLKLDNVIDADIDTDFVLVGISSSSELFMHHEQDLGYAANY